MKKKLFITSFTLILLLVLGRIYAQSQLVKKVDTLLTDMNQDLRQSGYVIPTYSGLSAVTFSYFNIEIKNARVLFDISRLLADDNNNFNNKEVVPWVVVCRNQGPIIIEPNLFFTELTIKKDQSLSCTSEIDGRAEEFSIESDDQKVTMTFDESVLLSNAANLDSVVYEGDSIRMLHTSRNSQKMFDIEKSHVAFTSNGKQHVNAKIKNDGLVFSEALDRLLSDNYYIKQLLGETFLHMYGSINQDLDLDFNVPTSFTTLSQQPIDINVKRFYHQDNTGVSDYSGFIKMQPSEGGWPNAKVTLGARIKAETQQHQIYRHQINAMRVNLYNRMLAYAKSSGDEFPLSSNQIFRLFNHEELATIVPKFFEFGEVSADLALTIETLANGNDADVIAVKIDQFDIDTELFDFDLAGDLSFKNGMKPEGELSLKVQQYSSLVENILNYINRWALLLQRIDSDEFSFTVTPVLLRNSVSFLEKVATEKNDSNTELDIAMQWQADSYVPKFGQLKPALVEEEFARLIMPYVPILQSREPKKEENILALLPQLPKYGGKYSKVLTKLHTQALAGNSESQYKMGLVYIKGVMGVNRSKESAMRFFEVAARSGHAKAGRLYEKLSH